MLEIVNRTPFVATLVVFPNPRGVESAYGAVKATFDLASGVPRLAAKQAQFLATDVYWGEPGMSSLRAAGDITLSKPSTDVIVSARAVAPEGAARQMDVTIGVGPLRRVLRVFGNRRWARQGSGWAATDPEPFERMPLRWENAFGGSTPPADGHAVEVDARNPVGVGLVASYEERFDNRPLPNVEDPKQLIRAPQDRPAPAGCAPIAPSWLPRRTFAGTYDDAWQRQRAPYLPLDFDPRFLSVSAPGFATDGFLVGGEAVEIIGCGLDVLRFELPAVHPELSWEFDGRDIDGEARLDTVLIEPDFARVQLIWRSELQLDKRTLRLTRFQVTSDEYSVARVAA